jgi:hypothetical protein
MSEHDPDEKVSPLVWLIPVPFVLAAFLPLTTDHPMPPKAERMAATSDHTEPAASAPARKDNAE